ncbi:hypothetical protein LINPERHAP2_LOCUS16918 [Linum perenne]
MLQSLESTITLGRWSNLIWLHRKVPEPGMSGCVLKLTYLSLFLVDRLLMIVRS